MDRRGFLKFLGVTLAAAGVASVTDANILKLADKFTDEAAVDLMALPAEESQQLVMSTFSEMLRAYLPVELLREELMNSDYFLSKIEADESYEGNFIPVPLAYNKSEE